MDIHLRPPTPNDAAILGDICHRAFSDIALAHGFPPDVPNADVGQAIVGSLIKHPGVFGVVAEAGGRIVGSNFLDERNPISGVGPITVDPDVQNGGAGARLMEAVLARSAERGFPGVRLVQAGYHCRSLALYLKLGFEARAQLVCLQGPAIGAATPGYAVRPVTPDDVAACDALCLQVHGHHRGGELADAVAAGAARLVERGGRITGYATAVAFFSHAVAETSDDLIALIAAADGFGGPGFLAPSGNGALIRWCLAHGLKITQTMTLMSVGLYNQPIGAWLPSVTY